MTRARKSVGRVSFVGTGTGDAGLLTVRAAEVLAAAEVAYVDASVSAAVRALIGGEIRAAEPIRPTRPRRCWPRPATARWWPGWSPVTRSAPRRSTREALAVAKTALPYEVVPALSEAAATATYAGVPVGPVHTEVDLRQGHGGLRGAGRRARHPGADLDAAEVGRVGRAAGGLRPQARQPADA